MQSHTAIKWQKVGFKSRQSGAMVCSLNHYAIITSLSTYVSVNNRAIKVIEGRMNVIIYKLALWKPNIRAQNLETEKEKD